jgi:hypothetical protein
MRLILLELLLFFGHAFHKVRLPERIKKVKSQCESLIYPSSNRYQLMASILAGLVWVVPLQPSLCAEEKPSLEKCFNAVRRELSSDEGQSLKRLKEDVFSKNWADVKSFTREYDAGFRGYVLKNAWSQITDDNLKRRGIEISNSFTFDLIALNKAARIEDPNEANKRLEQVGSRNLSFMGNN